MCVCVIVSHVVQMYTAWIEDTHSLILSPVVLKGFDATRGDAAATLTAAQRWLEMKAGGFNGGALVR